MIVNDVNLIYFSPTGTSKKVGQTIIESTGLKQLKIIDITFKGTVGMPVFSPKTLVVISVPVYGGHVAPLAMDRLAELKGCCTPAIIVVVYGNRDYEKSLVELSQFVTSRGFKVISAATFIGEHSYSNEKHPIAMRRPDESDLCIASNLAGNVIQKLISIPSVDVLDSYVIDVQKITRPKQSFFSLLHFKYRVAKLKRSGVPLPRTPYIIDAKRCTYCGLCVSSCPVGAITSGDELNTDAGKCIKCCACVKVCKRQARVYDSPFSSLLADCFKSQKEPQIMV